MQDQGWLYRHQTFAFWVSTSKEKSFLIDTDFVHTLHYGDECLFINVVHKKAMDITIVVQSTKDNATLFGRNHILPNSPTEKTYIDWAYIPADVGEVKVTCISNNKTSDAKVTIRTTDSCYN